MEFTRGQWAAARAAVARRGELRLTQDELAERSGVSKKSISNFERGLTWPRARQLGQLERLGLNWPVGYLRELADDIDYPADEPEPIVVRTEEQGGLVVAEKLRMIALLEEAATTERERAVLDELRKVVERL